MSKHLYSDQAETTLEEAVTIGTTTIPVVSDVFHASLSATNRQLATIYDGTGDSEVVAITNYSAGDLTVERAVAGTAKAWGAGSIIVAGVLATGANNWSQRIDGSIVVLSSGIIDLESTADDVATFLADSVDIPADTRFLPLNVRTVILTSDTVSGDPTVALGTTTGGTDVMSATAITETDQYQVTTLAVSSPAAVASLYVSIKAGGTATALTGKIYVEGYLVDTAQ